MRAALWAILFLCTAWPAVGLDCATPAEVAACASNADCRCGASTVGGTCQVGVPACTVDSFACGDFCAPFYGIAPVCRAGRCVRARQTACAGDCDLDAAVTVDEVVSGVAIALQRRDPAVCRWFDTDGSQQVEVAELIAAVRAALHGCLAERQAAMATQRLFDGEVTFEGIGPVDALGILDPDASSSLTLQLTPNSSIQLSTTGTDDDLRLAGSYLYTDIAMGVSGSASIRSEGDAELIEGTFDARRAFGGIPTDFALRRSTILSATRFAGDYDVRFFVSPSGGGSSRALIALAVTPQGLALSGEATDVADGGAVLGTVASGECRIAPEGHLSCTAAYLEAGDGLANLLRLTGRLSLSQEGVASGEGQFVAGIDPPRGQYVVGSWQAQRQPER